MLAYFDSLESWSDSSLAEYDAKDTKCVATTDSCSSITQDCDMKQFRFEGEFCTWSHNTHSSCGTYGECYANANTSYFRLVQSTQEQEAMMKVEYAALKSILCYLDDVLLAEGLTTEQRQQASTKCDAMLVDTSVLNVSYWDPLAKQTCITWAGSVPGQDLWYTERYQARNISFENTMTSMQPSLCM